MCLHVIPTDRALARAGQYRLLALGFAYPETGVLGEFRRVLELHARAEGNSDGIVGPHLAEFRAALRPAQEAQEAQEALEAEYTRLFDRTIACSPYESENVGGMRAFTKSRDLADVQGFYKAFGLDLGPEAAEMGDHIRVELEFLSTLALKEAYFREEGADEALEITMEAQVAFLRDHVGRWVPAFCDRLDKVAEHPFYRTLGAATRARVVQDLEMLAIEPLSLVGPGGGDPDDLTADEMVCPLSRS